MGMWSDLTGGSPGDGRASVENAILLINERLKTHTPSAEYLDKYKAFVADWIDAKSKGLTSAIVQAYLGRAQTWISVLATQGVDTSGIALPKLGDGKSWSWWGVAIKAAIVGGAIYGGYKLISGDGPPRHDHENSE